MAARSSKEPSRPLKSDECSNWSAPSRCVVGCVLEYPFYIVLRKLTWISVLLFASKRIKMRCLFHTHRWPLENLPRQEGRNVSRITLALRGIFTFLIVHATAVALQSGEFVQSFPKTHFAHVPGCVVDIRARVFLCFYAFGCMRIFRSQGSPYRFHTPRRRGGMTRHASSCSCFASAAVCSSMSALTVSHPATAPCQKSV